MKALLLIISLSTITLRLHAQKVVTMESTQNDSIAITQTLADYFKGIFEGDTTLLGGTFYPGTLLFGDVKGVPYQKTLAQYLEGVKNRKSPKESGQSYEGKILSIEVLNSIAFAKVRVSMYDLNYHDFLSFHKIDGKWLIVNKMITHVAE
jgi:hypothetical protein